MHPLKLAGLAVLGVCLFSAGATTARADTFALTGGRAATGETTLNLFLSGPNFQLDVGAAFAPNGGPLIQGCSGSPLGICTSGATFNLDFSVDAGEFTYGRAGTLVVNGTTYPPFRFNGGSVNWVGSAIVPTLPRDEALFSMPFTMSGAMFGTNILGNLFLPPDPAERVIFSLSFEASGTALVDLDEFHRPGFVNFLITSGSARFDPVVPEPATLLLLSTSLAGVALLRSRRR